ncbi:hypothetical protein [Curtobacterium sp. MCPF17_052]|uniref:hypothetical protein n=1 Tax=Curtobacterium sp. MCPF17_052 TaxID=2175655 RepID=UPI0024DF3DDC|nr:hypothetical protein [Curtobacterium sp. MCPF17_052]WIB12850.1 hypothetical protein DEJ36_01975 [Curtobacterium sp. MCPF17_052]
MDHGGVLSADAPDPEIARRAAARSLRFGIAGLVAQRHLEDFGSVGVQTGESDGVRDSATVSRQYTLWRNPEDHDDPVNLAAMDDERRRSLEEVPPWPRPDWLVATVERMRYPMLWEAVQTHWSRRGTTRPSPAEALVGHVQYVLVNGYRDELAPPGVHRGPLADAGRRTQRPVRTPRLGRRRRAPRAAPRHGPLRARPGHRARRRATPDGGAPPATSCPCSPSPSTRPHRSTDGRRGAARHRASRPGPWPPRRGGTMEG